MAGSPFLLHQSEEKSLKLLFILVSPSYGSFLNLLFCTIRMSPVTICPWFGSVNGDVVQLQGKLFVLSKMSLVSNVVINSLWLNILDRIVLDNVYTVQICSVLLKV